MKICTVIGHVVSIAKHLALEKTKILVVRGVEGKSDPESPLQLAVDGVGAGIGSEVVVTESGAAGAQVLGIEHPPVRSIIVGIID
jgi:ethanolamine utilization protein EutN